MNKEPRAAMDVNRADWQGGFIRRNRQQAERCEFRRRLRRRGGAARIPMIRNEVRVFGPTSCADAEVSSASLRRLSKVYESFDSGGSAEASQQSEGLAETWKRSPAYQVQRATASGA